jgi:hypothetical protein
MKLYIVVIYLGILGLFTACQSKGSEDAHAHDHDDVTLPYTGYSDEIEVFADVEPLAFQSASELIVHFTNLSNFKPVTADSVTLELISGGKGIRQTQKATRQPGIFKFMVKPVFHGNASLRFLVHTSVVSKEVSIPDVVVFPDAHSAVHEADGLIPALPNAISFTKENAWKVNFATDSVRRVAFGAVIKGVAQVEPAPLDMELVSARTSGFVKFVSGALTAGKTGWRAGDRKHCRTVSWASHRSTLLNMYVIPIVYFILKGKTADLKPVNDQR